MSRLWPETVYIGLFPGYCWLRRERVAAEQSVESATSLESAAMLHTLEKMLDEQSNPVQKGSRLVLTVSDSLGAIATLPWQEELTRPTEIEGYAQVCFEKLGVTLGDNWVMHTEFRNYGGTGLAYALPREWLEALLELLNARGLRLTAVLPVSAAAYCKQRFGRGDGRTLLLLQELNRASVIIYGSMGLLGYDVEPVTSSLEQTRMRLLNRVASAYNDITRVTYWSVDQSESQPPVAPAPACFPEVELCHLKRDAWN